jgi:hypothetical protein
MDPTGRYGFVYRRDFVHSRLNDLVRHKQFLLDVLASIDEDVEGTCEALHKASEFNGHDAVCGHQIEVRRKASDLCDVVDQLIEALKKRCHERDDRWHESL